MSSLLLLERLSDKDLVILLDAAGEASPGSRSGLRSDPDRIRELIERPETFRALFGTRDRERFVLASPFLAFSVLLAQTARDLAGTSFVEEWTGRGRRLPVFDVAALQDFVAADARRLFLVELLSSYTHVASGVVWTKSGGRWKKRRFSELDPVQLARLAEAVPDRERLAVYRRLGDLALFLSGVFPDHASRWLEPQGVERIGRALHWKADLPGSGSVHQLESVGRRAYELAAAALDSSRTVAMAGVVAELPERFTQARRVLNFLTERNLFPLRDRWLHQK
jgi:hypothetical protein